MISAGGGAPLRGQRLRHRPHPDLGRHRGSRRDLDEQRPRRRDPVRRREAAAGPGARRHEPARRPQGHRDDGPDDGWLGARQGRGRDGALGHRRQGRGPARVRRCSAARSASRCYIRWGLAFGPPGAGVEEIAPWIAQGVRTIKVKIGRPGTGLDEEMVRAVRESVPARRQRHGRRQLGLPDAAPGRQGDRAARGVRPPAGRAADPPQASRGPGVRPRAHLTPILADESMRHWPDAYDVARARGRRRAGASTSARRAGCSRRSRRRRSARRPACW